MGTREQPLAEALAQLCAVPLTGVARVIEACAPPGPAAGGPTDAEGPGLTLDSADHGRLGARPAASCLLAPGVGDSVWFAGDSLHGVFVLAVLRRGEAAPQPRLRLPADTRVEADGTLALHADGLRLEAREAAQWVAGSLQVQARQATVGVGVLTVAGGRATLSFDAVKLVAGLFEGFVDRCIQFCRWSQRTVDGQEQLRCRQMDYQAEQLMQLQAGTLVANADTVLKLDGPQIHVG